MSDATGESYQNPDWNVLKGTWLEVMTLDGESILAPEAGPYVLVEPDC